MYQSTAEFGTLVQQDSRTFKCLLTYGDTSITTVKSIKFTGGSEGEDDFSLGSTISQYIEVTIPGKGLVVEGTEMLLQIGMDVNGKTEYIPMGYFTAGKPKKADDQITFTAYDRMMNTERTFSMDDTTTNTVAVLKKIAEITGVPVVTTGLTAISMKVPKGYSCREVLSYVAQLHGMFAVCNRTGQIELHTYVDSTYKVGTGRYWGNFEHNDYAFNVTRLVCATGEDENGTSISITAGSGTRTISLSNPFMTQAVLDKILTSFKNFSYMPGTLKMLGDPRLDPWDILTVEDLSGNTYKVPVMKLEWEYDGGLTYSVEAVGLSEEETNADYKGPQTKEMERYYAQLVMLDRAMINKLDVGTAKITYASIKELDVVKENVGEIDAKKANLDLANVNNAWIKKGVLKDGSIGSAAIHEGAVTNAKIADATIEASKIKSINADSIVAGTIKTERLIITGPDGQDSIVKAINLANGVSEAEVNSQKIQAASIDVIDLSAFQAKIAQFDLSQNAIYSGKTSITDPTSGVYISTTGFGLGDGSLTSKKESPIQMYADGGFKLQGKNSSLKFDPVTDMLDINVSNFRIGSKEAATTDDVGAVEKKIDDLQVGGRNLLLNTSRYAVNSPYSTTSNKTDNYIHSFDGKPIYTVRSFKAGDVITVQAQSNIPWASDHGNQPGKSGFWLYYGSADQVKQGGYTFAHFLKGDGKNTSFKQVVTIPSVTNLDDIYIAFRFNTYSDGAANVTGKFWNLKLEKGNTATDWTPAPEDGLESVDVEYYLSTSATSLSGDSWSTTAPTWVNGKYMWSRTVKIDGSGNKTYSPSENGVCIAGAKGDKGDTGAKGDTGSQGPQGTKGDPGATGKGIKSVVEQYYKSTSNTTQTGGSWTTTYPGWENGKYIWTRSVITYTDNTSTTTTPICVTGSQGSTGAKGDKGEQGSTGPQGVSVTTIKDQWYKSTSNTTQTGGSWSDTQPSWESGKYIWTRSHITFSNGNTTTTNPVLADAINNANANAANAVNKVNNLSVGGRNLVLNSHKLDDKFSGAGGYVATTTVVADSDALSKYHIESKCTTAGSGPHYPVFQKTADKIGKTYTWSFWAKCSVAKTGSVGHECGGQKSISLTTSWQKFSYTWKFIDYQYYSFTFYLNFSVGEILYIRDFKIEEGTQATTWTPAPEDVDSKVSTANTNASNAVSTANTANSTANTAKSTADAAKSSAASAVSTANTANSTANTAKTTADTAKSTADAAKTTASNAASTANTAKSTADTAKSTADSANSSVSALDKIATKNYSVTGATGKAQWVRLGTLTSAGNSKVVVISLQTGNGFNGNATQNAQAEIIIKDGWQQTASTTAAFGVSVTRQNTQTIDSNGKVTDYLLVSVRATASTVCEVWVYLGWAHWDGNYTISGIYEGWNPNVTKQDAKPTNGVEQDLAYRTTAEDAYRKAENIETTVVSHSEFIKKSETWQMNWTNIISIDNVAVDKYQKYITFDNGTILLGHSTAASKVKITNDSIQFKGTSSTTVTPDSDATAWITGKVFHIDSGEIESSLKFGKVRLKPSSNNTLIIRDPDDKKDIAEFGSTIRIGEADERCIQINEDGLKIINKSWIMAHIGYGSVQGDDGNTITSNYYTFGIRNAAQKIGGYSMAEGYSVTASGYASHAEGNGSNASGNDAHAEGTTTQASSKASHAEGMHSSASGQASHAEGYYTVASGHYSHAEGLNSSASGWGSHASGGGTIANGSYQTVIGKYNVQDDSDTYSLIIGNGGSDTTRSNALTVGWGGDITAPKLTSKSALNLGFNGGNAFKPYLTKGDSVSGRIMTTGYVTNASTYVDFVVPLSKPVVGATAVSVASVNGLIVRQSNKYLFGSSASEYAKPSSYEATLAMGGHAVNIIAKMPNSTNVVSNNDACGIDAQIKLTFS